MLLNSFSSFVSDALAVIPSKKYKVLEYNATVKDNIIVTCELLTNGELVHLKLNDIFQKNKLQHFLSKDIILLTNIVNKKNLMQGDKSAAKSTYYHMFALAFIICLLISNLAATKLCDFFGYILPGGTIIFPILYIINDILTEVYGFRASRKVISLALLCNFVVVVVLYLVVKLPAASYGGGHDAFATIFLLSPKIFFASVFSYFLGELTNATIISFLKIKTAGKYFAFRAVFSTMIGSLLESVIFCSIAFFDQMPPTELLEMIVMLTIIKVLYELMVIPFTAKIVVFLKTVEGRDVFEQPTLKHILSLV